MPLVPEKTYMTWFNKKSWMYSQFSYCYRNPLWKKDVPGGYSLCPYFWQSLLIGFLLLRLLLVPSLTVIVWVIKHLFNWYLKIGKGIRRWLSDTFLDMKGEEFVRCDGAELLCLLASIVAIVAPFMAALACSVVICNAFEKGSINEIIAAITIALIGLELFAIMAHGLVTMSRDKHTECKPMIYVAITAIIALLTFVCINIKVLFHWFVYTLICKWIWTITLISIWEVLCGFGIWTKTFIINSFFNTTGYLASHLAIILGVVSVWILIIAVFRWMLDKSTEQVEKDVEEESLNYRVKQIVLSEMISNEYADIPHHIRCYMIDTHGVSNIWLQRYIASKVVEYIIFEKKLVDASETINNIKQDLKNLEKGDTNKKEFNCYISGCIRNLAHALYKECLIKYDSDDKDNPKYVEVENYIKSLIVFDKIKNPYITERIELAKKQSERAKYWNDLCAKTTEFLTRVCCAPFIVAKIFIKKTWHIFIQVVSYFWDRAKAKKQGYCPYVRFIE